MLSVCVCMCACMCASDSECVCVSGSSSVGNNNVQSTDVHTMCELVRCSGCGGQGM